MTPSLSSSDKEANIRYRLQRSYETLEDAEFLISNHRIHSGINRLYYACFYSVVAYLLKIGLSPKSHSGVKQMFGLHVVKENLIDPSLGGFFPDVMTMRITGDYDEFIEISQEDACEMLQTGKEFIQAMNELING